MPIVSNTNLRAGGVITPSETVLTASDTLNWDPNTAGAVLVLRNTTAGALSPTITGSQGNAAFPVEGVGTVNTTTPIAVGSIAAGAMRVLPLDSRREFLRGTITVAAGTGLLATILTF